ncbi:MAG: PAS domain-containing protein [Polyangiaceae bacterium]
MADDDDDPRSEARRGLLTTEFLQAVLDCVGEPIFVKDRDFRFVLLNSAMCALTGYERASLLGGTDYDIVPVQEADFFRSKDEEVLRTGREVRIEEERLTDRGGARHLLATTKVALCDAAGDATHVVGVIHDITHLKSVEDELRVANEELERRVRERTTELLAAQEELVRKERLAVLGQLAGSVAHQIRNPLAAIINASVVLRKSLAAETSSDAAQALSAIDEEVWRANRIIVDLLDYARVRPAVARTIAVAELLESTLAADPPPRSVSLRLDLDDDLPPLAVDPVQTQLALGNLVRNALEAMCDGGELHISATHHDAGSIRICVADSGPGLDESVLPRLFEPLVTTKPLGVGLGLATSRSLIENQGGSLALVPGKARGATFEVILPICPRDSEPR